MGVFIELRVNVVLCHRGQPCRLCVERCPVDIFVGQESLAQVVEDNEDECILCGVCMEVCPTQAVSLFKLYEERGAGPSIPTPGVGTRGPFSSA